MFFKKCEKKKSSAKLILIVGALAAVGAFSITRKGKDLISAAKCKVSGFFKKDSGCDCNGKDLTC